MIKSILKTGMVAALMTTGVFCSFAQKPVNMSVGIDLYQKGLYSEAARIFSQYPGQDAKGYEVLCLTALKDEGYEAAMHAYEENYPASGLLPMIHYKHGLNLFDKTEYAKALPMLEGLDADMLDPRQKSERAFKLAYCRYSGGDGEGALHDVDILERLPRSSYTAAGEYLGGYIQYEKGRYAKAEDLFKKSGKDPRFKEISEYYIADCRFRSKDYKYLTGNASKLFESTAPERKPDIARMISESYLVTGNTEKAAEYYGKVVSSARLKDRSDWFYAGSLLYATGDYKGAINNFSLMTERTDSLGQIAEYQMAYSYIKTGDKVSALGSFKAASALDYDPVIKEDAMFNSAKLSFDLNHDPSVFNGYIAAYPKKEKSEMIYEYMALAALYDKDYARAVEEYDKIEELNPDQRNNYMKANYLRANQLISGGSWRDAVPYLQAVSFYSEKRSAVNQLSRYWMAEAAFREGDMAKARSMYNELYNASALDKRPEGKTLPYNVAYTYLREDNPSQAARWFGEYIASGDKTVRRDALVRRGDCQYVEKKYADAATSYGQAVKEFGSSDDAYALYQQAMAEGLAGKKDAKTNLLSKALNLSPTVPYRNEAVYELGRSYVAANKNDKAAACYKDLVAKSKDTTMISRSLIGLGMIATNQKKFEEAAGYYKRVVSELPESQYTEDALMAMESVYQAMGKSKEYVEYLDNLGPKGSRSEADKERILFSGAEQTFLAANYAKALSELLAFQEKYPQSQHISAVDYYVANCYNNLDNKDLAVDTYNKVLADENAAYREAAALEQSRLLYGMERFADAYKSFKLLKEIGTFADNLHLAKLGMMESAYKARQAEDCIAAADLVLADKASAEDELFEAKYLKAKSLQQTGKRDAAFALYKELGKKPSTQYGAEARYLVILDAYDRAKYKEVQDLVFAFSDSGSTNSYYLAKAFIVLGDSYADQDEFAQAKATFESIRDGYGVTDDGVLDDVKMRLQKLDELSKTE
ncbi:MAG: tetratricopeptide repeat protein [Bacteroidales bacterium]|nr:tetratricopeptide repeat protein [Bacteroidales bacterium]